MANKATSEDQQRESSSPLPSYGLSKLCDIANPDTVRTVMDGLSHGTFNLENIRRVHNNSQDTKDDDLTSRGHNSSFGSSSAENANGTSNENNENSFVVYYDTQEQLVNAGAGGENVKVEEMENSYVQQLHVFFGSLGNTECIQTAQTANFDTINHHQLQTTETVVSEDQLFGEGVAMEVTVEEGPDIEGILEQKVTFIEVDKYSRFRYESERSKAPRSAKGKNLDRSEDYKNLGTVKIEGYHGQAWLIIFCVDSQDRIHPYSLHGEYCKDGIYQRPLELQSDCIVKLNKVTCTTPKSKEYKEIFKKRRQQFKELNIDADNMQNTDMDKTDKNTVYLHAEVIFTEAQARTYAVSSAIHNKKEGHEFKIYTIEPASAPATGNNHGNPNKNRVLIVLTEATACPKSVAVKIKSKNGQPWEVVIRKIKIIRKSVIEFTPPPFWNPDTDTNEECEITLVDEDTNDETCPVTFVYYSVKDMEGIEERRRKKPRLDTSSMPPLSRQVSGVSMDVLETLDHNRKRPRGGARQSTEVKTDIPKYSDVMYGKPNMPGSEKVYSLKDNSRSEGLVARGSSSPASRPKENGSGRSSMTSGQSPGQSPASGFNPHELHQSQLTVSLPSKTTSWSQGNPFATQNTAALTQNATCTVVTSASSFSIDRQPVTATVPSIAAPLSAGFQPNLTPTSVAFPPNVTLATPTFPPTVTIENQQPQQTTAQLQTLLLQSLQQIQEPQPMPDWQKQQLILQQQADELQQQQAQVQAQQHMLQQQMLQQQKQQFQQLQQQQQAQQVIADSKPQADNISSLTEKRMKHEIMSAFLEKEAQKMNPGFKLPSNQMFLMLGDKITIADRSLVDIVFPSAGQQTSQNIDSQLLSLANQLTATPLSGSSATQPIQSAKVTPQYAVPNHATPYQAPPVVQQAPYPQLQNMAATAAGNINQYQNPSSISFQQYTRGAPSLQQGTSIGNQQLSALGLGTRILQSSSQSGKSIFLRNNLPFSAANLDDDDVEIDSEGPKRKKPIQLYGKASKKPANGLNMKNGVSLMEEPEVIDLTMDTKNKNKKVIPGLVDLNDSDLETDCFRSKSDKLNAKTKEVEWKNDKSNKTGLHIGDKVRRESDYEVMQADDSGVFSMEEAETQLSH